MCNLKIAHVFQTGEEKGDLCYQTPSSGRLKEYTWNEIHLGWITEAREKPFELDL